MRHFLIGAAAAALLAVPAFAQDSMSMPDPSPAIEAAVADMDRPEADRELDAARHPAEILAFAGVEPGWRIADLTAGAGYYTRILANAVGPDGHVWTHNPSWVAERYGETNAALGALAAEHDNMTHVTAPIADFAADIEEPLDAVFLVLFYHDTAWDGTDRAAMNAAIYDALKPGGVFLVIDHHAAEGTGLDHVEDLHRIEESVVEAELEAAGFVLDGTSDVLANAEDDHTTNVFDPAIRRHTDRFVLRFVKPDM